MLMAVQHENSEAPSDEQQIAVIPDDDEDQASVNASTPQLRRLLTQKQREFCRAYVFNGGNGRQAAIAAGYKSPDTSAYSVLLHPSVMIEIRRLSMLNAEAKLPVAIKRLVEIIEDPKTPAQAAVNAALGLMDRAGLKPKSSPLVAIQNNTYNQASGSAVQQAIAEIWAARDARLSDIAGGMPDKKPKPGTRAHYRAIRDAARAEQGQGGDPIDGAVDVSPSIPGTQSAHDIDTPMEAGDQSAPSVFDDGEDADFEAGDL